MEIDIRRQALWLAAAFALGAALGLCYDILRPLRRKCGTVGAAGIDFVFALLSCAGLFVFSMSADSGRLGLWELCAALLGFLGYIYTLSDYIFNALDRVFSIFLNVCGKIKKFLEIIPNSAKKVFKKMLK